MIFHVFLFHLTTQNLSYKANISYMTCGYESHQESGDGSADDEASDDIGPVVAVFSYTVQTGEEGQTH